MNKSIKKTLFITIILINIFFFNTYKVNAKIDITECYYVLPNSHININASKVRNVYDVDNIHEENYISFKTYEKDKCPKYITVTDAEKETYKGSNEESDSKYIDFLKNYYNIPIKKSSGITFSISPFATFMSEVKYIPLYYYRTTEGEGNKCYLDKNIDQKQGDYCNYQYSGIDPINKYVQLTALGYSNLLSKKRSSFISGCDLNNKSDDEKSQIYKNVIKYAKNNWTITEEAKNIKSGKNKDTCLNESKAIASISAAAYYYSMAMTNGGPNSKGFKEYSSYYDVLINSNSVTYGNSTVEINSDFLALADLKSTNEAEAVEILSAFVDLSNLKSQTNELSNVYKHICDYSSFDSTQCYNAKNACRNGDSPTSENIKTCYKQIEIAAQAQVGICDSLLAKCMEESQGITDATNALAKLNGERASLNTEITRNENILKDAKKSIKIKEDQSNPLSMLNGTVDSSANFECSDISFLRFIWLIMIIAAPILTIVFGVLDFTQAVMAGDEQKMNKLKSKFINRLVALALFIILPIIIKTIVNISDNDSVRSIKMAKCIVNGED